MYNGSFAVLQRLPLQDNGGVTGWRLIKCCSCGVAVGYKYWVKSVLHKLVWRLGGSFYLIWKMIKKVQCKRPFVFILFTLFILFCVLVHTYFLSLPTQYLSMFLLCHSSNILLQYFKMERFLKNSIGNGTNKGESSTTSKRSLEKDPISNKKPRT